MNEPTLNSSDSARWWDQYVELAGGEDVNPALLEEFIQLTQRLVHAAEDLDLDSSPLFRIYMNTISYDMGNTDTLPHAGDDVYILLERMRLRLDKLASSRPPESSQDSDAVEPPAAKLILNGLGEQPIVLGRTQKPLTVTQYEVVKALVEAGPKGLTKDALEQKTKHTDARKVLKRVAEISPEWAAIIQFAGKPGGGYRILN